MKAQVASYIKNASTLIQLKEALKSEGIDLTESPELNIKTNDYFVVCDLESFIEKKDTLLSLDKNILYLISEKSDEENMLLIEKYQLYHLVGYNEGVFATEITQHINKSLEGKIWGFKPYMEHETETRILSLSDSKYTNEMIQEALGHFNFDEYFSSPQEYIQVMANELISNSLYKGPNKKRQDMGLDAIERKSPVFLKGSELVLVTLGMDNKGVALSVQDSFGGLTYELLIQSLKRSFDEKTPLDKRDGAGLGLYLTFLHSNQFIVNLKKDFRTEVVCIIEKNKRYKHYKQRIRSFHFFQEVPSEKTHD